MYNKKVLYKKRQKVTNHRQSMEQRKRNKKDSKYYGTEIRNVSKYN